MVSNVQLALHVDSKYDTFPMTHFVEYRPELIASYFENKIVYEKSMIANSFIKIVLLNIFAQFFLVRLLGAADVPACID